METTSLMIKKVLLSHHEAMLREESSIKPEVIAARGYLSATRKCELEQIGFASAQRNVPTLVIPIWSVMGEIVSYQLRPDTPRIVKGKPLKYEFPHGMAMSLDVHPAIREMLCDPKIPLYITEGSKKADAAISRGLCCVALLGVWNWRGTNEQGGKTALADWESIALNGRRCYIVFDSDVMTNPNVYQALARLKEFLERRGAKS